uniref:Uncharacterized protein n=1 Tax=Manihot esculenta TaxID=3983 RepID=A0A2C9UJX0_MANES
MDKRGETASPLQKSNRPWSLTNSEKNLNMEANEDGKYYKEDDGVNKNGLPIGLEAPKFDMLGAPW